MKTLKKFLPFLLAATATFIFAMSASAATSGTCGENLTWTFEDGTLTISGTGEMNCYRFDYSYGKNTADWKDYANDIKNIVIEDGVTSIGNHSFTDLTIDSIIIPKSVKNLNNGWSPKSIENLYISDLNSWCDMDGSKMYSEANVYINNILAKNITIPDNISELRVWAFYGWKCLESVTIPSGVISINKSAFDNCSNLTNVNLSEGVITIDNNAFQDTNIKEIQIPNSVKRLGDYAFWGCNNLTSITLPGNIEVINADLLGHCSNLSTVTIEEGITSIGGGAFSKDANLTTITIPKSLNTIFDGAFNGTYNITDIYYGGTAEEWNNITGIDNISSVAANATIHYSDGNTSSNIDSMNIVRDAGISVYLNNEQIQFDVQPAIINDRTMVPMRAIFESLGASVEWNQDNKSIKVKKDNKTIESYIGEKRIWIHNVNDKNDIKIIESDVAPCIIDDRTLVPVRVISEALNCDVNWNGETKTVSITTFTYMGDGSASAEKLRNFVRTAVNAYIANLKNPSSAQIYSVYAGYYERSECNESVQGRAIAVVIDGSGENSFGGTTRDDTVVILDETSGEMTVDLEEYAHTLRSQAFAKKYTEAVNLENEALYLQAYKTTMLALCDESLYN